MNIMELTSEWIVQNSIKPKRLVHKLAPVSKRNWKEIEKEFLSEQKTRKPGKHKPRPPTKATKRYKIPDSEAVGFLKRYRDFHKKMQIQYGDQVKNRVLIDINPVERKRDVLRSISLMANEMGIYWESPAMYHTCTRWKEGDKVYEERKMYKNSIPDVVEITEEYNWMVYSYYYRLLSNLVYRLKENSPTWDPEVIGPRCMEIAEAWALAEGLYPTRIKGTSIYKISDDEIAEYLSTGVITLDSE